jgi:hypothetical protein
LKGLFDQFVAGRVPDVTRHGQLRATAAVFEFILSYFPLSIAAANAG